MENRILVKSRIYQKIDSIGKFLYTRHKRSDSPRCIHDIDLQFVFRI